MNKYIDHTNLKPTATAVDIIKLCNEAKQYNFRGVCVNPCWVTLAASELIHNDIKIISVVGFPLGASSSLTKTFEAIGVINGGVDEIDMVWNLGLFKDKKYLLVTQEIGKIVELGYQSGVKIKVIVETCYLEEDELIKAYQIVKNSGAFCIKTSTGFGPQGAQYSDIVIWKTLGNLKIKASGGIKTYHHAKISIDAGADIIGTSHGVSIMEERNRMEEIPLEPFESTFPNPCQTDDFPRS